MVFSFCAIHDGIRQTLRGHLLSGSRVVLSTTNAKLVLGGSDYTIAKIKGNDRLFVEIYENLANGGGSILVEKFYLPDNRDGFFDFNGQATNLAIFDIDDDGAPEILAPSFDQNLVGRLNVYSFSPDRKNFDTLMH